MSEYAATYLSLGAGVQSTALLVLAATGRAPRPDWAIFADTGDEPVWVYEHLWRLAEWSEARGIPVHVVTAGHLSAQLAAMQRGERRRFATIPAWTARLDGTGAAPMRRQCTREYKIEPIERHVRRLLGFRRAPKSLRVRAQIGISLDEAHRAAPSMTPWVIATHPLLDLGLRRSDCARIVTDAGFSPRKSSCVFCPFHGDRAWRELRDEDPAGWAQALETDALIRDMTKKGMVQPVFLHRSLRPLAEVDLDAQVEMVGDGFGNDCSGHCGV